MPRPLYIICSRGFSDDKHSNLISLFAIMETLTVSLPKMEQDPPADRVYIPSTKFVNAVWMYEPGDEGVEFEHEFRIHFPSCVDEDDKRLIKFETGNDKILYRFTAKMESFPVPTVDCYVEFESRLRRPGGEWISQKFPLRIKHVLRSPDGDSQESAAAAS